MRILLTPNMVTNVHKITVERLTAVKTLMSRINKIGGIQNGKNENYMETSIECFLFNQTNSVVR